MTIVAVTAACGGSEPQGLREEGDFDGDGIADEAEGRSANVDTDGDGIPDYRDLDSDGDGITDAVEAGDADLATPPIDTDNDGIPDFRDPDSDGDGIPDFRDTDSDGDTISDRDETNVDTDGDGLPDFRDLDSDNDGIPDACEAGDANPITSPRDTDKDGIADFRDLDSDSDGIADGEEDKNHSCSVDPGESSPTNADTDGDKVPDLVEKVAGTDPTNAASTIPKTDFYFVLPYQQNRGTGDIEFSTDVRQHDRGEEPHDHHDDGRGREGLLRRRDETFVRRGGDDSWIRHADRDGRGVSWWQRTDGPRVERRDPRARRRQDVHREVHGQGQHDEPGRLRRRQVRRRSPVRRYTTIGSLAVSGSVSPPRRGTCRRCPAPSTTPRPSWTRAPVRPRRSATRSSSPAAGPTSQARRRSTALPSREIQPRPARTSCSFPT